MSRIAFITGATSGIGKATANLLAAHSFDLIITGRRKEKLKELEDSIMKNHNIRVMSLPFDVRNKVEVEKSVSSLPVSWQKIEYLINNAGLAVGLSHIDKGEVDDWERMIDTNIKGLLYVTRTVVPLMIAAGGGHIVNIASIAGKEVYENGNVYCATKHAVEALSKAMRIDLLHDNIKVTNIAPGMVETEFSMVRFKGDKSKADKVHEGLTPLYAEDIADAILFAITRPPHVNINDMLIMPTSQAAVTFIRRK